MAGNSIGKIFRLTSFGESHGEAIGGIIDACPAGFDISIEQIQNELNRRRPGQSILTSSRDEKDKIEILSGIFEGKTTGMPIGFLVYNNNQRAKDYEKIKNIYRPSHADYTYDRKYGIRDYRGGGRSSAREHIARVVAGAIAKQILAQYGIEILAFTSQIGKVKADVELSGLSCEQINRSPILCPDIESSQRMQELILKLKQEGDSIGAEATCIIRNVPIGLGEPVFDKYQARLAYAMMSINAVKAFEYGSGTQAVYMKGSEHNDAFYCDETGVHTASNHSGGIQGGISNGEDINMRISFKAIPSISQEQNTITKDLKNTKIKIEGRHDPCVLPRAIVVVEAMAAITTLDLLLEAKLSKLP